MTLTSSEKESLDLVTQGSHSRPKSQALTKFESAKLNRALTTRIAIASVLVILGSGNILYGGSKLRQYTEVVSKAHEDLASPEIDVPLPSLTQYKNKEKEAQQLRRVKARLDFYSYVVLGGKILLAVGAAILLSFLLRRRPRRLRKPS